MRSVSARRALSTAALTAGLVLIPVGAGSADAPAPRSSPTDAPMRPADVPGEPWVWPVSSFRLAQPYVVPAHEYGPGHRGIDLEPSSPDIAIVAPAAGVVAFSGPVAERGILTIDHGDGLVTTLEPVASDLAPGTRVRHGEGVAALAVGGHATPGALHFGVRLNGEYINPMLLLGGVPRAVLLPCCPAPSAP